MQKAEIAPLAPQHQSAFLKFADQAIGKDYFRPEEFAEILDLSLTPDGASASFVLVTPDQKTVLGMRLTYPPGLWLKRMEQKRCFVNQWVVPPEQVGYFKSLFIAETLRGQGYGPKLSRVSLDVLRKTGCQAVVTHSWKESPNNSSQRYLEHFGFKQIGEHPRFWSHIDYNCTRCGSPPCLCTAVEMIYYLNEGAAK